MFMILRVCDNFACRLHPPPPHVGVCSLLAACGPARRPDVTRIGGEGRASGRARRVPPPRVLHTTSHAVRPRPDAGPWTRVAAAGGRSAARIAARVMPSRARSTQEPTVHRPARKRTLGASSLVPSRIGVHNADHSWSADPRSDRRPRVGSRVPPGAAAPSLLCFSSCVYQGALATPPGRPRVPVRCALRDRPMALLVKRLLKHT